MGTPPLEKNEEVYRQLAGGQPVYYDPSRKPPVHQSLFLPNPNDVDGLSVIRKCFRRATWAAFRIEQPETRYQLAEMDGEAMLRCALNARIDTLHFDITPDELDIRFGEPCAHCVVREINRIDYEGNRERKKQIKEWALAVARHVQNDRVIGPFEVPTADEPYRP